ncbi:hypothetical protein BVI1335_2640004 [Burkholderia vietnamiensis]|nr:hypothetical protein BVI1335_2640004 [Burkholderia vietnamiensis]
MRRQYTCKSLDIEINRYRPHITFFRTVIMYQNNLTVSKIANPLSVNSPRTTNKIHDTSQLQPIRQIRKCELS